MGSENRSGKVPLISKIAYGFGDVGCNFSWMFVSNFLMIFYTDVFGISMAAVSALMLFSRFWDAINDPIVGGLTDKTKTRWGRYRPWLLVAAPITAVLLVMTFWARPDWNQTAKIVYMVITYCLLVLGYTCVNIPYGTLCGAMTQDIDERAKINTSRSVAAMIAIGVLNIITVPLINKFGSSSAKTGYLMVAVIYGCIFAACHFFCFAKTKEAVITPEKEKISIKVQLKAVLQNRPYLLALVGQILFGFTLYGRNADVLYYFTYVEGNASYYTTYSMCKDGVRVLNFARGELVDTEALLDAMNSGKVAQYFCDFPAEELLGVKGVYCTPHLGASTPESETNCAVMAAAELSDYLKNGNIAHSVNLPDVSQPRVGGRRICMIHKNTPGAISAITSILTTARLNIENMVNKSKKDVAYTLLDVTGDVTPDLTSKLAGIDAAIRVRIL